MGGSIIAGNSRSDLIPVLLVTEAVLLLASAGESNAAFALMVLLSSTLQVENAPSK